MGNFIKSFTKVQKYKISLFAHQLSFIHGHSAFLSPRLQCVRGCGCLGY